RWSLARASASSPWLLGRLAQSSLMAPFSSDGPVPPVPRPLWQHVGGTGAVTGLPTPLLRAPPPPAAVAARGRDGGGDRPRHPARAPGARPGPAGRGRAGGGHTPRLPAARDRPPDDGCGAGRAGGDADAA